MSCSPRHWYCAQDSIWLHVLSKCSRADLYLIIKEDSVWLRFKAHLMPLVLGNYITCRLQTQNRHVWMRPGTHAAVSAETGMTRLRAHLWIEEKNDVPACTFIFVVDYELHTADA